MGWATFLANFSQTHLVTLLACFRQIALLLNLSAKWATVEKKLCVVKAGKIFCSGMFRILVNTLKECRRFCVMTENGKKLCFTYIAMLL
jgi:hypothetical protein